MELCHVTLGNAMKEMNETLNQSNGISLICLYISYELFKQILEVVIYLHTRNPPIIHRDLKSKNILITNNGISGNFVKIADFGLATTHGLEFNENNNHTDNNSHTSKVGSYKYMAPEVMNSGIYSTESDMYSIAIIMEQLFYIKDDIINAVKNDVYKLQSDSYSESKTKLEILHFIENMYY
jgi:serine/threonine protein kinase